MLRLRADQLHPERERMQVGAEIIGTQSVAAAAEIVNVAIEALQRAGIAGITIDFTLPDLVSTLAAGPIPVPADEVEALRDRLDAKDAGAVAALGAAAQPYLALIEATGPFHAAMTRLEAFNDGPAGGALSGRIAALREIARPIGWDLALTLDPTERHGFDYQNWLGFSIFADGFVGEIGRGGTYDVARPDGTSEPAIGFSLYVDPLVDAGFAVPEQKRCFLPVGYDPEHAAGLRAQGWITVAALDAGDDARTLGCGYMLGADGAAEPLD